MTDLDRLLELYAKKMDMGYQAHGISDEQDTEMNILKASIEAKMYPEPHGYMIKELEAKVKELEAILNEINRLVFHAGCQASPDCTLCKIQELAKYEGKSRLINFI